MRRLAEVTVVLGAVLAIAEGSRADDIVFINNGLEPPNPENVINDERFAETRVLVGDAPCENGESCEASATLVSIEAGGLVSQLDVSGGSEIEVNGGLASSVSSAGNATIRIRGGRVEYASAHGTSQLLLSGGAVGQLLARDSAVVEVGGGRVEETIQVLESSRVTLRGGVVGGSLRVLGQHGFEPAALEVVGRRFAVDGNPADFGPLALDAGVLTGILQSGQRMANPFEVTRNILNDNSLELVPPSFTETSFAPEPPAPGSDFASGVAIAGQTVVVGAGTDDENGEDAGAAYIFERRDGGEWVEVKKLLASDGATREFFGLSDGSLHGAVAISQDTVVVGALADGRVPTQGLEQLGFGAVYVYERNHGGADQWGEVMKLTAPDSQLGDSFGATVAVSDRTIAASALGTDTITTHSRAVYLFERDPQPGGPWAFVAKLTGSGATSDSFFGVSVDLLGDAIVVSDAFDDEMGAQAGTVYVYERNAGGSSSWGEVEKLVAPDAAAGDRFGTSVRFSGNSLMVGASKADGTGAVYVFERRPDASEPWALSTKLLAPDDSYLFGLTISAAGDLLAVAARLPDGTGAGERGGVVYLFDRHQGGKNEWGWLATLQGSQSVPEGGFAGWQAMSGSTLVVGDRGPSPFDSSEGIVYAYVPEPERLLMEVLALGLLAAMRSTRRPHAEGE